MPTNKMYISPSQRIVNKNLDCKSFSFGWPIFTLVKYNCKQALEQKNKEWILSKLELVNVGNRYWAKGIETKLMLLKNQNKSNRFTE